MSKLALDIDLTTKAFGDSTDKITKMNNKIKELNSSLKGKQDSLNNLNKSYIELTFNSFIFEKSQQKIKMLMDKTNNSITKQSTAVLQLKQDLLNFTSITANILQISDAWKSLSISIFNTTVALRGFSQESGRIIKNITDWISNNKILTGVLIIIAIIIERITSNIAKIFSHTNKITKIISYILDILDMFDGKKKNKKKFGKKKSGNKKINKLKNNTLSKISSVPKASKILKKIPGIKQLSIMLDMFNISTSKSTNKLKDFAKLATKTLISGAVSAVGAVAGSVAGPVGSVAGGVAGWEAGDYLGEKLWNWGEKFFSDDKIKTINKKKDAIPTILPKKNNDIDNSAYIEKTNNKTIKFFNSQKNISKIFSPDAKSNMPAITKAEALSKTINISPPTPAGEGNVSARISPASSMAVPSNISAMYANASPKNEVNNITINLNADGKTNIKELAQMIKTEIEMSRLSLANGALY